MTHLPRCALIFGWLQLNHISQVRTRFLVKKLSTMIEEAKSRDEESHAWQRADSVPCDTNIAGFVRIAFRYTKLFFINSYSFIQRAYWTAQSRKSYVFWVPFIPSTRFLRSRVRDWLCACRWIHVGIYRSASGEVGIFDILSFSRTPTVYSSRECMWAEKTRGIS